MKSLERKITIRFAEPEQARAFDEACRVAVADSDGNRETDLLLAIEYTIAESPAIRAAYVRLDLDPDAGGAMPVGNLGVWLTTVEDEYGEVIDR